MKDETCCSGGDCYKAAYDYVQQLSDKMNAGSVSKAPPFLVHGDVIPTCGPDKGRRINHAWVEMGDDVLEVSNGQKLQRKKEVYYRTFQARDRIRYRLLNAQLEYAKSMHYGPWDTDSAEPAIEL